MDKLHTENIAEARRYDPLKPMFVFLWPKYHQSGPRALDWIEDDFWRMQLQLAYDLLIVQ